MRPSRISLIACGVAAVAAAAVLAVGPSASAGPAAAAPAGTVSMSGTGEVTAAPDVLRAAFALSHTAPDVSTALARANASVRKVRDSLRDHGVADADISTTGLQVYGYGRGASRYHAYQSMAVVIRDLDRAGRIVADAAQAGGDAIRIDDVAFTLSDRAPHIAKARDAAFAEAKAKAQRYAAMTGRALGQVRSVSEGVSYANVGSVDKAGVAVSASKAAAGEPAAAAAAPVPFSPGRERTSVYTTVVWELR